MESLIKKSSFHPWLAWIMPYKSPIGPKLGENIVIKIRLWYYTLSIYKYYQLTFFLILIEKIDQKSNFQPQLVWTRPYKSQIGSKREENVIFESRESK